MHIIQSSKQLLILPILANNSSLTHTVHHSTQYTEQRQKYLWADRLLELSLLLSGFLSFSASTNYWPTTLGFSSRHRFVLVTEQFSNQFILSTKTSTKARTPKPLRLLHRITNTSHSPSTLKTNKLDRHQTQVLNKHISHWTSRISVQVNRFPLLQS